MTLIVRSDTLKGDPITQKKVLASEKVHVLYNALTQAVLGETNVTGLLYKDAVTGEEKTLPVDGVFVDDQGRSLHAD